MTNEQEQEGIRLSLKQIASLIPPGKRKGAVGAIAGSVLLAILDVVGIAALVSVLLAVLDETAFMENRLIVWFNELLGFQTQQGFVIAVCIAVLAVIAIKSILSLWISDAIMKYQLSLYRSYSARMFDIYLSKGLLFIRDNHTSQLINNVNGVCFRFTDGVVGMWLAIASDAVMLMLIVGFLMWFNPMIVLLALAIFAPLAIIYSLFFRKRMIENGKMENKLFVSQNKTLYETIRGYSDIEINNARGYISRNFKNGLLKLSEYRRKAAVVRRASGRVVEFALVLGVVALLVGGLWLGETMATLKISLGIFAVAAYKLVPGVNRIINCWIEIKRNSYAGQIIAETFSQDTRKPMDESTERLPFNIEIQLENVSFSYDGTKQILDDFSLTIAKGEKIGFKGYSGAGKTTLFNVICGFFEPTSGRISVDGVDMTPENRREWQNNLAYVSQDVFLPDISIAENIAFGIDSSAIDRDRLQKSIEAASLSEFVSSLPNGVDTVTGEGGSRISGGQRQRIGIARALYKDASVLMFDEATSSLDAKTENEIVQAIEHLSGLKRELTILIISHRERTLEFCDRIIEM